RAAKKVADVDPETDVTIDGDDAKPVRRSGGRAADALAEPLQRSRGRTTPGERHQPALGAFVPRDDRAGTLQRGVLRGAQQIRHAEPVATRAADTATPRTRRRGAGGRRSASGNQAADAGGR